LLRVREIVPALEYHLCRLGRNLAARLRRACLHDHRPALDWARDVERAAHGQKWPLVIEHVHPLGIEKDAVLDVTDEGVVRPAIPQAGDNVEELARPPVARLVFDMLVQSEIHRLVWLPEVTRFQPARPPLIWSREANFRAM
jgi:hypothetical protein